MSQVENKQSGWSKLIRQEDWWAVWLGLIVIVAVVAGRLTSPVLPGRWGQNGNGILTAIPAEMLSGILITGFISFAVFALAVSFYGRKHTLLCQTLSSIVP